MKNIKMSLFRTNTILVSCTKVLCLAIFLAAPLGASAQTKTWNGIFSPFWNNPQNWTPNGIPGAVNDVIIPMTPLFSPLLTSSETIKSIKIETSGVLAIGNGGELTINGSTGYGLENDGEVIIDSLGVLNIDNTTHGGIQNDETFTNNGTIDIGDDSSVGNYGIFNRSVFVNNSGALIKINRTTESGIRNFEGNFQNFAGIRIGTYNAIGSVGIHNITEATFVNEAGHIRIDRSSSYGIHNVSSGAGTSTFTNKSRITIGELASVGTNGILNESTFNNFSGGRLLIDRSTGSGIYNNTSGTFINGNDDVRIIMGDNGSVGDYGIRNSGTFATTGLFGLPLSKIDIDRSAICGIYNTGTFTSDYSRITIGSKNSVGQYGIHNTSLFTTMTGRGIYIDRTSTAAIYNESGTFTLNPSELEVGQNASIGDYGILNKATFVNDGSINIDDAAVSAVFNDGGTLNNTGDVIIGELVAVTQLCSGQGSGNFINEGGGRLSGTGTIQSTYFTNNGGILRPGHDGIGTITFDAAEDFSNAILEMKIEAGMVTDSVIVNGIATLGGTLNITGNYTPAGDVVTLFYASGLSGMFSATNHKLAWFPFYDYPNVGEFSLRSDFNIWTGVMDSDWDNTQNWASEIVPYDAINVIIPPTSNNPVINGNAQAASITLENGAALTVNIGKTLDLTSVQGTAFTCNGTLNNNGDITISATAGDYGLNNTGNVHNNGMLEIDGPFALAGIYNEAGSFNNSGKITMGKIDSLGLYGIHNKASFNNNPGGDISIERYSIYGLYNDVGTFNNTASIYINNFNKVGDYSIRNNDLFKNNASGSIDIDRLSQQGAIFNASGTFNNDANITTGPHSVTGFYGIHNKAIFNNNLGGTIRMKRIHETGIYNQSGTFTNRDSIILGNVYAGYAGVDGINNNSTFNNFSGVILMNRVGDRGIYNKGGGFNNDAEIIIGSSTNYAVYGIHNKSGNFNNNTGASIKIDRLQVGGAGVFIEGGAFINSDSLIIGTDMAGGDIGIHNANTFQNLAGGVIHIDNTASSGLYLDGSQFSPFINQGIINIGANNSAGDFGIYNNKPFQNQAGGLISVSNTDSCGIINLLHTFTTDGIIQIGTNGSGGYYGIYNKRIFDNNAGAIINIDNTTNSGIFHDDPNSTNGALTQFNNFGTINIGANASPGLYGIFSEKKFNNKSSGKINVDRSTDSGIFQQNGAEFNNDGDITIGAIASPGMYGLYSTRYFYNNAGASVTIDNSTVSGLRAKHFAGFVNNATLTIGATSSVGQYGIINERKISNNGGVIMIDRASVAGILNSTSNTYSAREFINKGEIIIGANANVGQYGIINDEKFENLTTSGRIEIDRCTDGGVYHKAGTFNNNAQVIIGKNASTGMYGIHNKKTFNNKTNGAIEIDSSSYSGIYNEAGTFNNSSSITLGANASVGVYGIHNGVNFNNESSGGIYIDNSSSSGIYCPSGTFNNVGSIEIGINTSTGDFGMNMLLGATFNNKGNLTVTNANVYSIDNLIGTYTNTGLLKGTGEFFLGGADLAGTIAPGLSPGTMTYTNNQTFTADNTLEIEINGTTPGTQHDVIEVAGTATISGTLDVTINYTPATNERIIFLTASSISGTFGSINPALPNDWQVDYSIAGEVALVYNCISTDYYLDSDGDGYGAGAAVSDCQSPGINYVMQDGDCDDSNPNIHPTATEVCNDIDDDCNSLVDDGLVFNDYYFDSDGDGYGAGAAVSDCQSPGVNYVMQDGDCDDSNPNIHPTATEICNGLDDDCNFQVDEGVQTTFYADVDGDGYGDAANTMVACSQPSGYVSDNTDCDDNDPNEFPNQTWYKDTDGDDYGDGTFTVSCERPAGHYTASELLQTIGDCNDNNAFIYPGAAEMCDNLDNDCNNLIDDGVTYNDYYLDSDGDGYGTGAAVNDCQSPGANYVTQNGDCNDNDPTIHPTATEICNGLDDNCNSQVDDGLTFKNYYLDSDGDGYGTGTAVNDCQSPGNNYVTQNGDCNDNDPNIHPTATEVCNGLDDDCNSQVDDGLTFSDYYLDSDGDGYGAGVAVNDCQSPGANYVMQDGDCNDGDPGIHPTATEICNGLDDDCNSLIDNNDPSLVDNTLPVITCQDITITLGSDGTYSLTPTEVYLSGSDNCGTVNLDSVSPSTFSCNEEGINTVTLTANDGNGNQATCNASVTVDPFITGYTAAYTNETCSGAGDGTISLSASAPGGQVGYSIDGGSNYQFSGNFTNLSPGTYDIVLKVFGVSAICELFAPDITISGGAGAQTWYKDMDGDSHSDGTTITACTQPTGYHPAADLQSTSGDCNDSDASEFPGQTWYEDLDSDGYGSGNWSNACQRPTGCYTAAELTATDGDCNDADSAVHPAATEVCNGIDDDCDGEIDEGTTGGLIWTGNVTFQTQAEVDAWLTCYSIIDGNLTIVGADINDLSPLLNLEEVTGSVSNYYNSILTSLDGLDNLATIGGNLSVYYNFALNDCCAIYDLVNGGVSGSISIFFNASNCNSMAEINANCGANSLVANPNAINTTTGNSISEGTRSGLIVMNEIDFTVFPNPAVNHVTIRFEGLVAAGYVRVSDIAGRQVYELEIQENTDQLSLNIASWKAGTYMVRIELAGKGIKTERLVVIDNR